MSNVLNNVLALAAIKEAWYAKLNGETKFENHVDSVSKHMRWTDAVSPTKNNLESGKSTATKEGYEELKELFGKILKAKKRAHESTDIGSAITDLKNALMRRQAPAFPEQAVNSTVIVSGLLLSMSASARPSYSIPSP